MLHGTRKSAWRRSALLVIAAVLVMTVMAACGKKDEGTGTTFKGAGEGTVIATYKDGTVTEPEFDRYLGVFNIMQPGYEQVLAIPQFKEQLLQQFVSYKVLAGQATEENVKKAAEETDKQMKDFEKAIKENADLKKTLDDKKVTNADVKTYLGLMLVVVEHMNSKVTEEQIKAEYEKNGGNYNPVTVRHVLVTTTDPSTGEEKHKPEEALKLAKEAKAELEAGKSWDEVAKKYSEDGGSKDKGGLYENANAGDWVEGFKKAALEQKVGVIGDPVETEYGYHVIKVEKRDVKAYADLDEKTKESVKSAVAYEHMNTFMKDEMPKQDLKITLPQPSPSASPDASASPSPEATKKPEDAK
ncbi:peptidylprolyl isomerase [Paenibacillus radicis (ex Gao et al. 2016)]|uniref:Foldase protein PrsA n=1 Tax=Paenibacillus radicis (ex Gao et al. 2016) TaxID=1737354 RepID=A0A917MBM6_9BACL|nr:peptidylprolyl isomerase [Paenibacillus radicis (ex Gao et al. 2016)]GGG87511.1 foldase protein PrsA [Paenibacillus radicis (ex Gao et al. 2016)]